ncbi:MAG: MBL fold metallo-hydrolase [Nanoarchaeota archaeon]
MKKISKDVYLIEINNLGESKRIIGVIRHKPSKCILIDSGLDDKDAKKIINKLRMNNLEPEIIINTHFHTDHIGGNSYIQKIAKSEIFAAKFEEALISCPAIEGYLFYSGAKPPKETINKNILVKSSNISKKLEINKNYQFGNKNIKIISLAGHTPQHIGIEVNNVLFCGDGILATTDILKHNIPLYCDLAKIKETLKKLKSIKNKIFVLSHYGATKNIAKHLNENEKSLNELRTEILIILNSPNSTEEIITKIFEKKKVHIKNLQDYLIKRLTILAFLSYLYDTKKITYNIIRSNIYWSK